MGPSGIPAESGASFQLISPDHYYLEAIPENAKGGNLAELVPLEYRARLIAFCTPSAYLPEELIAEAAKTDSFAVHAGHIRDLEKGKIPAFNQEKERIQALLPSEVFFEDLREEKQQLVARLSPPSTAPGPTVPRP